PYTITNKMYTIYVKDKNLNQALNIDQLSDGTKRIFFLLTHLVLAKMNNISLIGLEEPENCIHPKLLQQLIILMDRLSGDCKIIISSHSPYILDCVETSNIYVGKPNDYGLADFSKINNRKINSLYRDAEKYSSSVGQYLFELLSGDELDLEMLFDYLEN
ncbi:AAA family ATPase, partial [Megamonas sp.]